HSPALHPFPTRRSSDLREGRNKRSCAGQGACAKSHGFREESIRSLNRLFTGGSWKVGAAVLVKFPSVIEYSKVDRRDANQGRQRSEEHTSELQSRGHLV